MAASKMLPHALRLDTYAELEAYVRAFAAGPAFRAQHEGKDQIAHAGAIRHHQCSQDGAFQATGVHSFQTPYHEERCRYEQEQEQPGRQRAGAL